MLRNQFADDRDQFVRNLHHHVALVFKGHFVLSHGFFFSLFRVVGQDTPNSLLIPTRRKSALTHFCLFLRLRRRYATSGFPFNS